MTEKQLLDLKEQINTAKEGVAKLQGREQHLHEELKTKWNVDSIEAAKKKAAQLQKEIDVMIQKIENATEELEQKLENVSE